MKKLYMLFIFSILSFKSFAGTGWTGPITILEFETHAGETEIRLDGFNGACTLVTEGGPDKTWTIIGGTQTN